MIYCRLSLLLATQSPIGARSSVEVEMPCASSDVNFGRRVAALMLLDGSTAKLRFVKTASRENCIS